MNKYLIKKASITSDITLWTSIVVGLMICSCQSVEVTASNKSELAPKVQSADFQSKNWQLVWHDEFDYPDQQLDEKWYSQNSPSLNLYGSRWRENAVVKDGVLHLENRKVKRGGQDWTSGSIRSKQQFGYGYYEARYKYAGATATNNSFWLMTYPMNQTPAQGKKFEIDINEGHFPNEVNTNIHNWSDIVVDAKGKKKHPSSSRTYTYGTSNQFNFPLELPVKTSKVRLISEHYNFVHIRKFNVFNSVDPNNRVNLSQDKNVKVRVSGNRNANTHAKYTLDNNIGTSWTSQQTGQKWLELSWPEPQVIGEIELFNGWKHNNTWAGLLNDFKIQYFKDGAWHNITQLDVEQEINFAEQYHTFGLEWNQEEIIFYFEGKEIRREKNEFAHSLTPIWLSLAIISWDGPLTDKVDGTSMKVDYVRYYQASR